MALLDPYITKTEYEAYAIKGRTIASASWEADDPVGASRCFDHLMGVAPGTFNSATGTRVFSGNGKPELRLLDDSGQHVLQSISTDGLAIDTDGDGTADYTIDPTGEPWLVLLPRNAAVFSQPYDRMRLVNVGTPSFTVWTPGEFNIAITATWGWAAVPEGVKVVVQNMIRDMREVQASGGLNWSPDGAEVLPLKPDTWRRIRELKREFSYRTGVRVA